MGMLTMLLYHGSNMVVDAPRLILPQRLLDFGPGFYLTSNLEQAWRWANRTTMIRNKGTSAVSVFDFDEQNLARLDVLSFNSPNREWLRFVVANRTGKSMPQYDIVHGPVANDQTVRTINDFQNGYFSEEIALQLLLPQKLKDQFAFKTEKALQCLHFKEALA